MPIIQANNIDMYYEQYGAGENLVLISGLASDHTNWRLMQDTLARHYRILVFDNRGTGRSSAPDIPYTTALMADDTVALMQALGIHKAHIVGHSLGGHIVQQMAIKYPHLINKVIIACSRAQSSSVSKWHFTTKLKLAKLNLPTELFSELSVPFLFSNHYLNDTDTITAFLKMGAVKPYPQTAVGYARQIEASISHNTINELDKISAPALIVTCDEDILSLPAESKFLAKKIPHAKLKIIRNCAHLPQIEKPAKFNQLIIKFLQNLT
jgi:3-oxoadipate enol-lactonase